MIWHLTLASTGRLLLFPDIPSRVQAVQRVARHSAGRVVLFAGVDDHLHLVLRGGRSEVGRLGGILRRALARDEVSLQPCHVKVVESRRHLETLVGYALRQPAKHGLRGMEPLLWGTCLPDLVGARLLPGRLLPLVEVLPRLRPQQVLEPVGLPRWPQPLPWEGVGQVGLEGLERAVAGASGLVRVAREHTPVQTRARRALAALARGAGIPVGVLARHLGVSTRSVRRWRVVEEEELVMAARTWLDLSELLHRRRA